jgi:hypothetical protein
VRDAHRPLLAHATDALVRFVAGKETGVRRLRPYWLGRLRRSGGRSSSAAAFGSLEVMRPGRRPAWLDGALQRVIRKVGLSHPANLPGIAGPDRVLAVKLPLARPISRQAEPGASLEVLSPSVLAGRVAPCPVLPASGLIPLRRSPAFGASGDIPSAQTSGSSLRTFAFRTPGADPLIGSFGRPSDHGSCIAAPLCVRCSATRASDFPQPGRARQLRRPAALVGFDPSQCCSCHAGKAARHPHGLAHLPFPARPSRPIFAGRSIARGLSITHA